MSDQTSSLQEPTLKQEYDELVAKAQEHHPGVVDLMRLYEHQQSALRQSQEYLQLSHRMVRSTTTNSSL